VVGFRLQVALIITAFKKQESRLTEEKKSTHEVEKENKKAWQTPQLKKTAQEKGTESGSGSSFEGGGFS
jgi:hypothetical protein